MQYFHGSIIIMHLKSIIHQCSVFLIVSFKTYLKLINKIDKLIIRPSQS